jgi:hypothetical protein
LERVGGDENLLAEPVAIFASENSRLLAEIDRAWTLFEIVIAGRSPYPTTPRCITNNHLLSAA